MSERGDKAPWRLCKVFKSPRKQGMFLYVDRAQDLDDLPSELLTLFGEPEYVLSVKLTPTRKLALVEAVDVLQAIDEQDFFLQMPVDGVNVGLRKASDE